MRRAKPCQRDASKVSGAESGDEGKMDVNLVIGSMTLLVAVAGVVLALMQLKKQTRVTSAQHLFVMLQEFYDDKIRSAFSDYVDRFKDTDTRYYQGLNEQGEPKFKDDETEKSIDRMLLLFENICYQKHRKVIDKKGFACFEYQIWETLREPQVLEYIKDLSKYCVKHHSGFPFKELVCEGKFVSGVVADYSEIINNLKELEK